MAYDAISELERKEHDSTNLAKKVAQGDAGLLRMSAVGLTGLDIANDDAGNFLVSAKQGDAALHRVSAFQGDGASLRTSALQADAALLRTSSIIDSGSVSAKQSDAANLNVSSKSSDAGTLRISAALFPSTVGGLTIFRNLNLSSSVNVKATAGAIYGWHAYSNSLAQQYIKFYNVSGAINVGTDTPVMTIKLNVSGISEESYDTGLVGFTNGISLAALSGAPDDNTAPSPASAVGINLFYK